MMKNIVFCLLLGMTVTTGFAQVVNIEGKRIHSDTTGFDGQLEGGLDVNQNNSLLISATTKAQIQYKTKNDLFLLVGNWRFTNGGASRFVNDGMAHFRYNRKILPWLRWEAFTQVQYNELLNLRVRALVGTGPRFKMLNKKYMQMYAASLYMFEYENLAVDDTLEFNHRMSAYLSWTVEPNSHFTFIATTYYQPKLTDWLDYRISGNYTLKFKAFKRLAFKLEFNMLYDSHPPKGITNFIFNGSTGIIFTLRK